MVRAAAAFAQENNANAADVVPSCSVPLPRSSIAEVTRPADDHSSPPDHSVEQTGSGSRSEGDYRLEKKLSTFFPNAMWSLKRCQ